MNIDVEKNFSERQPTEYKSCLYYIRATFKLRTSHWEPNFCFFELDKENQYKQAIGTMRSCLPIVVVLVAVVSVQSRPQYGGGGGGNTEPECVTKYRDVNEIFQKEEFRNICKPVTK